MKKNTHIRFPVIITILILQYNLNCFSQTLNRIEFSSCGNSSNQLSISIAESINCIGNNLTVGSQQNNTTVIGYNNISSVDYINIYPIPTNNYLFITANNESNSINTIKIVNLLGEEILLKQNLTLPNKIDISNLTNGLLFLLILDNENQIILSKPIIKQ